MKSSPRELDIRETPGGAELRVHLTPGASKNEVVGPLRGAFAVKVTAQPEKGKANKALIALLSKYFRVPKSSIAIVRGHTSRDKTIVLEGVGADYIEKAVGAG